MTAMLAVVPSALGSVTSGSALSLKQSIRKNQARSSPRTAMCSSSVGNSVDAMRLFQDASKPLKSGTERLVDNSKEYDVGKSLAAIATSAALSVQAAGPALAEMTEATPVEMVDDSQYWLEVLLTSGVCGILYLVVFPLIIYNYLRLRWYKRNALETYFQFMLVFIFFPGLLLLAPFINFRRLPQEGAEAP